MLFAKTGNKYESYVIGTSLYIIYSMYVFPRLKLTKGTQICMKISRYERNIFKKCEFCCGH